VGWNLSSPVYEANITLISNPEKDITKKVLVGASEDVKKREHLHTAVGNLKQQPLRKTVWRVLRKLKIELPHNPAI
jgi:hypothetical protein